MSNGPNGFRVSLCKVILFQHVAAAIKAGSLNLKGSNKYRPLDDCLISRERWEEERRALLDREGLTDFADPAPVMEEPRSALDRQYVMTNRAACDETNPYRKFSSPGSFRVATHAPDEVEC